MKITYAEAWQIASEVVEMFATDGLVLPIQDQEKMAHIMMRKNGHFWNDHDQEWQPQRTPTGRGMAGNG